MTLYFNRTLRKIFDDEDAKAYFYNAFFEEYNIDLLKCKYIHLHDDDVKGPYRSTTIFFKEEQIIVFKAILFGSNYLPDDGYEIEIYLKKDIKSIKITSDSQYNPTYTFKIVFEKDIIEFTVKEQRRQNSDCKQTVKFLTEYWK